MYTLSYTTLFRSGRRAQHHVHLAPEAAARDQDQTLAALGELIRELHRDAAAERVPDDRGARNPEHLEEVADAVRVRAERVVAARLGGATVPEEVRRHDGVALGEPGQHVVPGRGAARDPVDQDQDRAGAARAVAQPVTVERDLTRLHGGHLAHAATGFPVSV